MRTLTIGLTGLMIGCLEPAQVGADGQVLKKSACHYQKGKKASLAHLTNRCLDDACNHLLTEIVPSGVAADWYVDGVLVAVEACEIELKVGEPGRAYVQAVMPTHEESEVVVSSHSSGPGGIADIIIGGGDEECNFWIASLGGCLTTVNSIVYASVWDSGPQVVGPDFVEFNTSPRQVVRTEYGSSYRWTPNHAKDPGTAGSNTPVTNIPNDVGVEHWFQLGPGERRRVWAGHGASATESELIDAFICDESGQGSLGGM